MTALSCLVLSSFTSCSKDIILDDTEALQATKLTATTSQSVTLTPVQDSYLKGSTNYNAAIVRLKEYERNGYLMFDLSQIDGEITSATLQFRINRYSGSGTIKVYQGDGTTWAENDLDLQNRPTPNGFLGSIRKSYALGSTQRIALQASSLEAKKTSLILLHRDGSELAFDSGESANPPKLIVTYSSSGSTAKTQTVPKGYYVTTNGKSTNNGLSESSAWDIQKAFYAAKPGDIVYVKAGNYGNITLTPHAGQSGNPIKFIGYTNTPGDVESNNGSTFNYGDNVDANKLPLLKGALTRNKVALSLQNSYVEVHNFQLQGYELGAVVRGDNVKLKNIITYQCGPQTVNSGSGKGIIWYGDNGIVENCFDYNSTSQGITLGGSNNSIVRNCKVYSNNKINPNGYYILLTGGTSNTIVENCIVYRDKDADVHRGHGFVLKDMATKNTIRNSYAYNTGVEANFSGVSYNTFDNVKIYGSYSSDKREFTSSIRIANGAHHNSFKNMYIDDCHYAINFFDYKDGYVGTGENRDLEQGGSYNNFINLQVNQAKNIIGATSAVVGKYAYSNNNQFTNCSFKNVSQAPFFSYQTMRNTSFAQCSFANMPDELIKKEYSGGTIPLIMENCTFSNVGFSIPK